MCVQDEILSGVVLERIIKSIKQLDIVLEESELKNSVNTRAVQILNEIQMVIQNKNYSDFEAIEKIVCIFEEYQLSPGGRHDF